MNTPPSFRQILEEKIQANGQPQGPDASVVESVFTSTDPAHLAYLLGNLGVSYWQPSAQRIYPAGPRPEPKAHGLNPEQQQAYDFFKVESKLSPAFTRRELKKAFRMMALRLHPDMNGGAVAPFLELKNSFEQLNALFN